MSGFAKRIDIGANAELLIQQWRRAPRMKALTEALLGVVNDHLAQPLAQLERRLRTETADGAWLDHIGERLSLSRPATNVGAYEFFSFDGSGGGLGFRPGVRLPR